MSRPMLHRSLPAEGLEWALVALALLAVCVVGVDAQAPRKAAAPAVQPAVVQPAFSDDQFDQWVFQQDRNASVARQRLNSRLALHVDEIDHACKLTDEQKKKLQLAGRGDIKHFFDRYETVKQKFQLVKHDQQKVQEIWQAISPLQTTLQSGLFGVDSLLIKSLRHTLTDDQLARYGVIARERRAFHHRATVELAVTVLEQGMPLRDAQRRELITLLMNQTKPPRKSGQAAQYYFIMYQLGRLPEEKLKPLFDNAQWKVVSRQLNQFKGLEPFLRQSGQLSDEEDEPNKAADRPAAAKQ
ncbi:MAG TPA: hypothetical protein VKU02_28395 [Gemmataceae bacterium]|nr:hypothetical protein [Gemmataceae bacterium]